MIGIGVGIDYALFIVTRYRQGLDEGFEPEHAVVRAIDTAGRAVVFAGCTVVISLLGLFLMGVDFVSGMAVGTSVTVAVVMLASITLLPALLGFVGRTIDRLSVRRRKAPTPPEQTLWYRWSRVVQRRPWPAAIGGLAFLLAAGDPAVVDAPRVPRLPAPTRSPTPRVRPTTSWPTASAPASTARWCWRRSTRRAPTPGRSTRSSRDCCGRPTSPPSSGPSRARRGTRRSSG